MSVDGMDGVTVCSFSDCSGQQRGEKFEIELQ